MSKTNNFGRQYFDPLSTTQSKPELSVAVLTAWIIPLQSVERLPWLRSLGNIFGGNIDSKFSGQIVSINVGTTGRNSNAIHYQLINILYSLVTDSFLVFMHRKDLT